MSRSGFGSPNDGRNAVAQATDQRAADLLRGGVSPPRARGLDIAWAGHNGDSAKRSVQGSTQLCRPAGNRIDSPTRAAGVSVGCASHGGNRLIWGLGSCARSGGVARRQKTLQSGQVFFSRWWRGQITHACRRAGFACRWGRAASAATPTLPHRPPPAARQHRQAGVDGFQTRRGLLAHERSDSTIGRQGRRRTEPQRPLRLALAAATARCRRADPPRWILRARRVWPAMARDSPHPAPLPRHL